MKENFSLPSATSADDVFPICGDYAPALQRIESFAQRLVNNEFELTLAEDETLLEVGIRSRSGEVRPLKSSDYEFHREEGLLILDEELLNASDQGVELNIEDSCIEIAR